MQSSCKHYRPWAAVDDVLVKSKECFYLEVLRLGGVNRICECMESDNYQKKCPHYE